MTRTYIFLAAVAAGLAMAGQPRLAGLLALLGAGFGVTDLVHSIRSHRR